MSSLAYQRCFNHAQREAVARCPVCARFFCRECVIEHEDRMLCAGCLRAAAEANRKSQRGLSRLARAGQLLLGILCAWFFFYLVGEILLAIPTAFHEGTMWRQHAAGEEE
jgi:hypothetical protein